MTGIGGLLKSGSSLAAKVARAPLLKAGESTAKNIAKATMRKPIEMTANALNKAGDLATLPSRLSGKIFGKGKEVVGKMKGAKNTTPAIADNIATVDIAKITTSIEVQLLKYKTF